MKQQPGTINDNETLTPVRRPHQCLTFGFMAE